MARVDGGCFARDAAEESSQSSRHDARKEPRSRHRVCANRPPEDAVGPTVDGTLGRVRKRSGLAWAALISNGMAWFGAAAFLFALAGERLDVLASGSWPAVVGVVLIVLGGIALLVAGILDSQRARTRGSATP